MTHDELKGLLHAGLVEAGVIPAAATRLVDAHEFRIFTDGQGRVRTYSDAAGVSLYPHDANDPLGPLVEELASKVAPAEKGGPDRAASIAAVQEKQKRSGIYGM
jgi:hypothetical protein